MIGRTDIINKLICDNAYSSYLEIGLNDPNDNFTNIVCDNKESVDPYMDLTDLRTDDFELINSCLTYHMTSDEMFDSIPSDKTWDIVFVDGLHESNQVCRDVINAIKHLNDGGCVVMHDCLPGNENMQIYPRPIDAILWNGDVWKAAHALSLISGVNLKIVNSDYGVGILTFDGDKETLEVPVVPEIQYYDGVTNDIFDIISPEYFVENFKINEFYLFNFGGKEFKARRYDDMALYTVFSCAKGESQYIREFVEHYLSIGFDKVFIANNDDDASLVFNEIKDYVANGRVQIMNISGIDSFQCQLYDMFMEYNNYSWCAYFDCDEFLTLTNNKNIKEVLSGVKEDCVLFNWMMFGSNNQMLKTEGTVVERFKEPVYPILYTSENMFLKSIVRGGISGGHFRSSHLPVFDYDFTYNIGGYYALKNPHENIQAQYPLRYKVGYLKHFYTKSYEEFLGKQKRGWPDGSSSEILQDKTHFFKLSNNRHSDYDIIEAFDSFNVLELGLKDCLEKFNMLVCYSTIENYYSLLVWVLNGMMLKSGVCYVFPNTLDDTICVRIIEMAYKTGNYVYFVEDFTADRLYAILDKYKRNDGDDFYMLDFT